MPPVSSRPRRCRVKDTAHLDAYFGVGFVGTEYPAEHFEDFQATDLKPESVYLGDQTKVVMYGTFRLGEKAECRDGWVCKFGCEDVKIQIDGPYISFIPPACDHPKIVPFCLVDGERKIRSKFYLFEYLAL